MSASLLTSLLLFPLSLVSGGGGVGRASVPPLRQALPLAPGSVVEVWHADRLRLGSFEGRAPPPSRALLVHLHDGQEKGEGEAEMIRIDAGQIVDVWPDRPQHPWPQVFRRAATMLSELPAHLFDLRPLWQTLLAAPAKRRAVTSTSVADVLFAPLLSPSGTPRARAHPDRAHRPADEVKGIGEGRRPRSGRADPADDETLDGFARRVAAGRLLSEERILFKRQPITLDIVKSDDAVPREAAQFADAKGPACDMWTPAMASGGGFKALQRAQVATRAQLSLTDSLKAAQRGEPIEWAPSELPVLAELEMVAIGVSAPTPSLSRLLSSFSLESTAAGARRLLLSAGLWVTEDEAHVAGTVPSQHGRADDDAVDVAGADAHVVAERKRREAAASAAANSLSLVEPFPRSAIEAAATAAEELRQRRETMEALPPPSDGTSKEGEYAKISAGATQRTAKSVAEALDFRVDLRSRFKRAFAIDGSTTEFRDDAISVDLEAGVIGVHITDLSPSIAPASLLDEVARLRLQSIYAASAPLHMLPPALLHAASLSDELPNECITALIQLDLYGHVRHCELVRSLIPPVTYLNFDEVDSMLAGDGISSTVHTELRALHSIAQRRERGGSGRAGPGHAGGSSAAGGRTASIRWRGTDSGGIRPEAVVHTAARMIVDHALSMYSYAAAKAARRSNMVRLPQAEHQRIATAPLRRYADLIAQRQLGAALTGERGMPIGEVAALELWIKRRSAEIRSSVEAQQAGARSIAGLRDLEEVYAQHAVHSAGGRRRFGSIRYTELDAKIVKVMPPRAGDSDRRPEVVVRIDGVDGVTAYAKWGDVGDGADQRDSRAGGVQVGGGTPSTVRGTAQGRGRGRGRGSQHVGLQPGRPVRVRLRSVDASRGRVEVEIVSLTAGRGSGRRKS